LETIGRSMLVGQIAKKLHQFVMGVDDLLYPRRREHVAVLAEEPLGAFGRFAETALRRHAAANFETVTEI
jgi:hypothetical protein